VQVTEVIPGSDGSDNCTLLVNVQYVEEHAETYVLPLARIAGTDAHRLVDEKPHAVLAFMDGADGTVVIADATFDAGWRNDLLDTIAGRRRTRGRNGELQGTATSELRRVRGGVGADESRLLGAEQTNTSMVFGRDIIVKLYRRLEEGVSLDLEIGQFLGDHGYTHTPRVLGSLDYVRNGDAARSMAVVQEFVANEGDAWALTLDAVGEYFERAAAEPGKPAATDTGTRALLRLAADVPSDAVRALVGPYLEEARLLGERTAGMHLVLASQPDVKDFAPEEFTLFYQRSLYQSMRNLAGRTVQQLRTRRANWRNPCVSWPTHCWNASPKYSSGSVASSIEGQRIPHPRARRPAPGPGTLYRQRLQHHRLRGRTHPAAERTAAEAVAAAGRGGHDPFVPLRRVRVGHGAAASQRHVRPDREVMERRARIWYAHSSAAFLDGYLTVMGESNILPQDSDELAKMLDAYLLEKAVYELGYELGNRPDWAAIPLQGVLDMLGEADG
jgi:maltose alpha-D-glucosyltransferase / alpha-amylase